MKQILLTGFEPFHTATANATKEIVLALQAENIQGLTTAVLPVEFGKSWKVLEALINEQKPDYVIALGQAEGRSQITPEQIAINLDDARIPDNAGNQPLNKRIIVDGDDGLFTTLPVLEIVELLRKSNIPAAISFSAGTYVCNHLFYSLQSYSKSTSIKSGFIHIPLMDSQEAEFPGLPTMPLESMIKGIKAIIELLHE
jgi:pyroglutamyl-peptidase